MKTKQKLYCRITLLAAVLLMAGSLLLCACGGADQVSDGQNMYTVTTEDVTGLEAVSIKGLEELRIPMEPAEISDFEAVQYVREQQKETFAAPEGTVIENGDTVIMDYSGTIAGTPFDGGAQSGYEIEIGTGRMIPGFEEGIIGMQEGETRHLSLTLPADYGEQAGQTAEFDVTIFRIIRYSEPSEAELAQAKAVLEAQAIENSRYEAGEKAWNEVIAMAEISMLPKKMLEGYEQYYESSVTEGYEDLNAYRKDLGLSVQDYKKAKTAYAVKNAKNELVTDYLMHYFEQGDTGEAYMAEQQKFLDKVGKTQEEAVKDYGEGRLRRTIRHNVVMEYLTDLVTGETGDTE